MVKELTLPAPLAGLDPARVTELDVRDDLRNGREPFSRIMEARQSLPEGGVLCLRAIFEPVPLYRVLGRQGFEHVTEQLAADDWVIWFYPEARAEADDDVASPQGPGADGAAAPATADVGEPVVLDVRGLEPPEPMVRTLETLSSMPPGSTLIQLNVRVPQMLLPQLETRGYRYTVHEEAEDRVRVVIEVPHA